MSDRPAFPGRILVCGCFDPLHIGHLRYLEAAKKKGDTLIVLLTNDEAIRRQKGFSRPLFTQDERKEMLEGLKCVDFVVINQHETAVEEIRRIRPSVYAKGIEYLGHLTPALTAEKAAIEEVGGELVFIDTPAHSSTDLIRKGKFGPPCRGPMVEMSMSIDETCKICGWPASAHSPGR